MVSQQGMQRDKGLSEKGHPRQPYQHILLHKRLMTSMVRVSLCHAPKRHLRNRKWEVLARAGSTGLSGLLRCPITEQGSSGGGSSRLQELRDILGLGVSPHRSLS